MLKSEAKRTAMIAEDNTVWSGLLSDFLAIGEARNSERQKGTAEIIASSIML